MRVELKPHQRTVLEKLDNGKILYGGTGVGKGITALAYFYEKVCGGDLANIPSMKKPRDLYILTTKKKRDELDWHADANKIGLGTHDDSLDGVKVTVDTWNNIKKYAGVKDAFFLFDEQRVVGSGAWSRTFISLAKHNQWIMLSATPGDTWLDYIPVFVANGWYKNRTEFKQRHVVYNTFSKFPKVDRYIETGTLVRHRKNVLVHMPYERHTRRHQHDIDVSYNKELFDLVKEKRWNPYEERPIRDVAEMFAVMRKVVNSDVTRLAAVETLTQVHPRLIVFYNFNYELEKLRNLAGPPWETEEKFPTVAEWNGHKHQPVPETDNWVYLVQYAAGAEGWNCITTDAICHYSMTYSYKHWHQSYGRIDRLNTPFTDLHYYRLISQSFIDLAVSRSLDSKKSFNEASVRL
jgi:hypothetical protein